MAFLKRPRVGYCILLADVQKPLDTGFSFALRTKKGGGLMAIPVRKRFWRHVKVGEPNECWVWSGNKTKAGYGRFKIGTKNALAHRVAYELSKGLIPRGEGYHGICVLHKCDNPSCCNPSHLVLGTQSENMQDMVKKGRSPKVVHKKLSKLTPLSITAIVSDSRSTRALAKVYGVSPQHIARVKSGARCAGFVLE